MAVQKLLSVDASGPLETTRRFLAQVWERSRLDGMFVPAWAAGEDDPRPALLTDPADLKRADPFAPLMVLNTAPHIAALAADRSHQRLAAVLRPCELRSLRELARRQSLNLSGLLLISIFALKLAVLPGETLHVQILREGKSYGQGVGYLDDGTMVVIENARRHIGREVEVSVTSVLQTAAGRMIFSEIKNGALIRKV